MIDQGLGGDIVYIVEQERASSPARTTSPTARPRPTRRTRCGCSPPSWASTASGSTAINPDGVVRGSGIFAGGWGAQRAAVYGVPGGGAGRLLRPAHPAQAGGAARARGRRGVRADRRRPVAHHRAAHPGRRRGRRGVPALGRPTVRTADVVAVDLGASSGRVMLGHVGPGRPGPDRGAPVRQPSGAGRGDAALGRPRAVPPVPGRHPDGGPGDRAAGRHRHRLLGGRLRAARRGRRAARQPGALPRPPHRRGDGQGGR